jgi:hypothetical protein
MDAAQADAPPGLDVHAGLRQPPWEERVASLADPIRHQVLARLILAQPDRVGRGILDQGNPDRRSPTEVARKPGGHLADRDVGCVKH